MGGLIVTALQVYQLILIGRIIAGYMAMSMPEFDRNNAIVRFLYDATEPVLRPIRQVLPQNLPLDFSPLVVFFAIWFLMRIFRGF